MKVRALLISHASREYVVEPQDIKVLDFDGESITALEICECYRIWEEGDSDHGTENNISDRQQLRKLEAVVIQEQPRNWLEFAEAKVKHELESAQLESKIRQIETHSWLRQ